jgi:hypothetical protein
LLHGIAALQPGATQVRRTLGRIRQQDAGGAAETVQRIVKRAGGNGIAALLLRRQRLCGYLLRAQRGNAGAQCDMSDGTRQ